MTLSRARERNWTVNGLTLHALEWGDPGAEPLLCLHGWLDNAASFSLLAPLLAGYHVVALDLTGHGRSDRRSADAGYQIWDDLPEILGVVDALGWERFNLLGHSRGAIISGLFAASQPQRVRRLVLLDAITPQPVAEAEFPSQLANFLRDKQHLLNRQARIYTTVDEAVSSRADKDLPLAAARLLAERNLGPVPGGYAWTTDPRLRGASAVKLTAGQIRAVLQALSMPTLLLIADGGFGVHEDRAEAARPHVADLTLEKMVGGHHFHMEEGVNQVAQRISQFLQT